MNDRRIKLESFPLKANANDPDGPNTIEVELSYELGGFNYFYSQENPRGYFIHVTPVRIEGGFRSFRIGGNTSGLKYNIKESGRFNRNTLNTLADQPQTMKTAMDLMDVVLQKSGLELEAGEELEAISA